MLHHFMRETVAGAIVVLFAYFCAGELLPVPAIRANQWLLQYWDLQQVVLLGVLSCLLVALLSTAGCDSCGSSFVVGGANATSLFALLNGVPLVAAVVTSYWHSESDNCPLVPSEACDYLSTVLDTIGLSSARLARLDLAMCLLLAARGDAAWAVGAGLGYAEAIPLHRLAGWWCAAQSALHSIVYLLFYLYAGGGLHAVWLFCFPAPLADGQLNRLGLVNFLGVLAFLVLLGLALTAAPRFRRRYYHVFQRLHLPVAAAFVLCCALHDLPILLFALPGLASWCVSRCRALRMPAEAFGCPSDAF